MRSESLERVGQGRRHALRAGLAFAGAAIALLAGLMPGLAGSTAVAAPPPKLWTACDGGLNDIQCSTPRGVAANPENGRVFVADSSNTSNRMFEFNAWGDFVKAWGWDVVAGNAETGFEVCVPANGDICQGAARGGGIGQFAGIQGVALDSGGNVYVVDRANRRVQKFDPDGNFLLMIGGEVNETSGGNVCPRPGFPADACKGEAAASGGEPGQFGAWAVGSFIAIAPTDKVYVGDQNRIQRFDADGVYQDECAVPGETVQSLATDSSGNLYAIYGGKIRKLSPTPACEELPPGFPVKNPNGGDEFPTAVAVDAAGHVFAFGPTSLPGGTLVDPIFEFDPAGNVIENFGKGEFSGSTGLAANLCSGSEAPGNLYVSNIAGSAAGITTSHFLRAYGTEPVGCFKALTDPATNVEETSATLNGKVTPEGLAVTECSFEYGTNESYGQEAPCEDPDAAEIGSGSEPVPVHAELSGLEAATVYHFRLTATVGGEAEQGVDEQFKTKGPPVIGAEHTAGATQTEATLKALVNPEGLATSCHFEYVEQAAFEAEAFADPLSTAATAVGSDRAEHTASVVIKGLAPGETYRWRILCANASGAAVGAERAATTYRSVLPDVDCPNQALRSADAAFLPDCRAYELVSPLDKNGGDIVSGPGGYIQAAPDGNRIAYTALTSFGDQQSSFLLNEYLAEREAGVGWSSRGIHPPATGRPADSVIYGFERGFMAFSADLCDAWLVDYQTPPVSEEGQVGFRNLYRRQNCEPGAGGLEALIPAPPELPEGTDSNDYVENDSVQGTSEDSRLAFFVAKVALPHVPEANAGANAQIYLRACPAAPAGLCAGAGSGGRLELASVLPDGSPGDPAPGDGMGFADPGSAKVGSGWTGNLEGAVSADGSRLFWTAGNGRIFQRRHPGQGVVAGECGDAAKACTTAVSAPGALFWAASPDGTRALYSEFNLLSEKTGLFEYREGEPKRTVAEDIDGEGVVGTSEDLARVYFFSERALAGAGPNSEEEAQAGEPNLYLQDGGTLRFIGTLSEGDLGTPEPGATLTPYNLATRNTNLRAARVSPDGGRIAFQSRAPLTGFDNTDANSGKAAVEVFTYAAGGKLHCVSCNPSGAWPSGRMLPVVPFNPRTDKSAVPAAAWIPGWEQPLNPSNVLAEDGSRIFFNSNDALLPRDTNGAQDVYEWEAAGKGSCEAGDPDHFPQNGGCLYLISSGESPSESEFWAASPDGRDVFFTTASSLLPQDPGLVDLYDARAGGGIAQPAQAAACEGEACQSAPPPPAFPNPSSTTYDGPGDVKVKPKRRCAKGKRKVRRGGRVRCVKKHAKRRAGHNRRRASR